MSDQPVNEIVFIVEEETQDGGYSARCSRWGIYTQGEDLEELRVQVREAVACRFEGQSPRVEIG